MDYQKFKQAKAIEQKNKKKLLEINPRLDDKSGIYFLTRVDEDGIKFSYIGQARHVISRLAQHMSGYTQHIDKSLKAHGLYSSENPYGWKVDFVHTKESDLDEMEQHYIKKFANAGYQLRNKTSGSQGVGKKQIDEYRPVKGYRDGVQQGKISLARDLKHIIDKHLTVELKPEKQGNKVSMKALEKFNALLDENNYKQEQE